MTSFSRNLIALLPSPDLSPLLDLSVLSPVHLRVVMSEFLSAASERLAVTHLGLVIAQSAFCSPPPLS